MNRLLIYLRLFTFLRLSLSSRVPKYHSSKELDHFTLTYGILTGLVLSDPSTIGLRLQGSLFMSINCIQASIRLAIRPLVYIRATGLPRPESPYTPPLCFTEALLSSCLQPHYPTAPANACCTKVGKILHHHVSLPLNSVHGTCIIDAFCCLGAGEDRQTEQPWRGF
ncbi:unnamed protein product [Protopolystoma xenopodis]|uniref:Secreted protein n=1 Tax=Protopolystoma xenopodis TaxID=117903 RepID=A0A3S5CG74_9PLAT|nr:unnamed protein product [Protopolystoma xenopodis]